MAGIFDRDNPKSRFHVTPRIDIESQLFVDLNTPNSPSASDSSPIYGPFSNIADLFNQNDNNQEKFQLQNTTTTTSTSSSSSFYNNTIYKYNKLKPNDGNSLDAVYFPELYRRRPSANAPHSVVGIAFYNERILVYNFLQRPTGIFAISYHIFVSVAVVYCLVLTIMSTTSNYSGSIGKWLNHIDYLIILFFIVEFLARLWSSECVSYYRGWKGKIRFFQNPIRIIDLFVIIVSLAVVFANAKGELLVTSLRGVRFIQIFQMVRLDFKFRPWRLMMGVIYSQRIHLAIVFYMGFLALILVSFIIYFVEKDYNEDFDSLASSMWWAVITLCTIGYGDVYPKTSTGKLLACVCSLIGVSIFALPAGILGTGLALKVQEQQRQLKMSKRKQPAARLIQCAWKLYKCEQQLKHTCREPICDGLSCRSVLWKRFEKNKSRSRILTTKEMNSVLFMFAVKMCIAKRDFIKAFKPYDIKDVLEQYSAGHADMLAKVRTMDHRLEKIQSSNISPKAQQEFRLRLATHLTKLEYEIQKVQLNVNEILHYQIDSRLIVENLLKYLIDQQISLPHSKVHNRDVEDDRCQFCYRKPLRSFFANCKFCCNAANQAHELRRTFEQTDFPTKMEKTFISYNDNLLKHLLQPSTSSQSMDGQLPKQRRRRLSF